MLRIIQKVTLTTQQSGIIMLQWNDTTVKSSTEYSSIKLFLLVILAVRVVSEAFNYGPTLSSDFVSFVFGHRQLPLCWRLLGPSPTVLVDLFTL